LIGYYVSTGAGIMHENLTSSNNSKNNYIRWVFAVNVQVIAFNFISNSFWFANWSNPVKRRDDY
jgi:hypothetical protein